MKINAEQATGLIYKNTNDYNKDIISLAKSYIVSYLLGQTEENSMRQHLFSETLLRREVEIFLGIADDNPVDITELDSYIREKADASVKAGVFLPLEYLCRLFGLSNFERLVLMMAAAFEFDAGFQKAYAFLHNDWEYSALTGELAKELCYVGEDTQVDEETAFAADSVLSRHFLYYDSSVNKHRDKQPIYLKPEIRAFIYGETAIPVELSSFISYYTPEQEPDKLLLKDEVYRQMLNYLKYTEDDKPALFYLYGSKGIGKKLNVKYFAGEQRRSVLFFDLEAFTAYTEASDKQDRSYLLLQKLITQAVIRQSYICISSSNRQLKEEDKQLSLLNNVINYLADNMQLLFLTSDCTAKLKLNVDKVRLIPIELAAKGLDDYRSFWEGIMQSYCFEPDVKPEQFSTKYILTAGQIKAVCEEAAALAGWRGQKQISRELLLSVCRDKLEHNLGKKAVKVKPVYDWEDLILPKAQKNMLQMACNQIQYRYRVLYEWGYINRMPYGTGLSMIFSGPPGTGKTMAAQVMARELELELYKIELAAVVSKYIGETERNLNEIFEEAQKSQAIIFFDEADVLFSKRSEVKDSNDKYSNMEAAFMLQKMEEYNGIVILATNYQQNIDEAFKRRIKFLIDFSFPDKDYRKQLWQKAFPEQLPLDLYIDFDFLAEKFELTGSNIRNIALNAAYLAAADNSRVGMPHIISSIVNEFGKSGKKLSREELGEYYTDLHNLL